MIMTCNPDYQEDDVVDDVDEQGPTLLLASSHLCGALHCRASLCHWAIPHLQLWPGFFPIFVIYNVNLVNLRLHIFIQIINKIAVPLSVTGQYHISVKVYSLALCCLLHCHPFCYLSCCHNNWKLSKGLKIICPTKAYLTEQLPPLMPPPTTSATVMVTASQKHFQVPNLFDANDSNVQFYTGAQLRDRRRVWGRNKC